MKYGGREAGIQFCGMNKSCILLLYCSVFCTDIVFVAILSCVVTAALPLNMWLMSVTGKVVYLLDGKVTAH